MADDLVIAGQVLIRPVTAARAITGQPRSATVLIVLLAVTAILAVLRVGYAFDVLSGQAGQVASGWLARLSRVLAFFIAPAGEALKLAAVAYLFWAGLVFIREVAYREIFSAVVHAEIPLLLGGIVQTAWIASRAGARTAQDLVFVIGLNLAFPSVPLSSPLGIALTRVNPFMLWWGIFLLLWLRAAARMSARAAAAFVLTYWVLFTGVLISIPGLAAR